MRSTVALEQTIRLVFGNLPATTRQRLAGPPIVVDGARLDPDLQLLLRLERMTSAGTPAASVDRRREHLDAATALVGGRPPTGVTSRALVIDRDADGPALAARLYVPVGLPIGSPLLVYLHGGGWVTGSLNSHDTVCRFLARTAGVRLLAVDYRLAPEHPFPAAVTDVVAGFRYARTMATEFGADPGAIALGGDSAGANLAAVTAHLAARAGEPGPDRLLLFYPALRRGRPDRLAGPVRRRIPAHRCRHRLVPRPLHALRAEPRRSQGVNPARRRAERDACDPSGDGRFRPAPGRGRTVRPTAGGVGRSGDGRPRGGPGARIRQHDRGVRAVPGRRGRGGTGPERHLRGRAGRAGCPR